MTTTEKFQKLPDYFSSVGECKLYKHQNTNPRYKNFNQVYFTAGDVDQFYTYKDQSNGNNPDPAIDLDENVWYKLYKQVKDIKEIKDVVENTDWDKYKNITSEAVDNTFKYIFDKFKKGIFIKIKDNQLSVFLPFSKHDYINEWSDRIKADPKYGDIVSFIQYSSKLCGYDIPRERINWKVNTWYGNNCLIRPEFPIGENDRGLANIKDMITTLCKERVVPDIELFINKRDFPLITKSDYEPYEHIYDMDNFRLTTHKYNKYSPILSMVTSQKHADIPIPTHEDWARICSQEEKFFAPECRDYRYNFSKPWDERLPTAVFRGASTGCGVTVETNPRLKVSFLSTISPIDKGHKLLDAGITKWNLRPRKVMGNPYLQLIEPHTLPFWKKETNGLVTPLSPEQQSNYKYIVNVDGHVNAFRLSLELSMGSVVLLVDSKYRVWFRRYLIPYVHFVPVKEDLSNLFEQIKWCKENDKQCQEIVKNAKNFYDTYLTKKGVLDYLQYLFFRIKKSNGIYFYNSIKVEDLIISKQIELIKSYGFLSNNINFIDPYIINYPFSNDDINYYSKEGLRLFLETVNLENLDIKENIKNILHESHDTIVYKKYINDNLSFLIKKIKTIDRKSQLINETFCGLTEINKLSKEIPHFRFTYGITNDKSMIISEYIQGKTLKEYIIDGCTISELSQIFVMLTLALDVSQEICGFVHYDLYPWNIIIKKLPKKQKITYKLKTDIIIIETDIIPVIVDYGRVHIIHNKEHYGTIEPFKTSRIQDCFCMIVSCLFEAATQQKDKSIFSKELNKALYIINFYSGTNFQKNKITKYTELMEFLSKNKKYNEMIFGNKCDLERSKLPYDLFIYLMNSPIINNVEFIDVNQISYPNKIEYPYKTSHPSFYYEVIAKKNPNKRLTSYILKLSDYYESLMGTSTNKLIYTNVCNTISDAVIGVLDFIDLLEKLDYPEGYKVQLFDSSLKLVDEFYITNKININMIISEREELINQKNLSYTITPMVDMDEDSYFMSKDKIKRLCKTMLERIVLQFTINYDEKNENLEIEYFPSTTDFSMAKYNTKTFSIPEEILSILQGNMLLNIKEIENKAYYLLDIKNIMMRNFFFKNRFNLDQEDELQIIQTHKKIMKMSNLVYNNYSANMKTLKNISKLLYTQEKNIFLSMNQIPTKLVLCIDNILSLV
jgi:hypothetical protein